MNMQPKRGQFGTSIEIRSYAEFKQEKTRDDRRITLSHLSMATTRVIDRITADYPEMKPRWYCLQVMTGREIAVEKHLALAGVEVLVVRTNPYRVVRRGRIKHIAPHPVITGYVLVRVIALAEAISGLLGVDDVIGIVGGPLTPYRAIDEEIDRFKGLAEVGAYDHRVVAKTKFMVGEQVRVKDGPFASFCAIVITQDLERFRVCVEVNIFGRATPVDLDVAQIDKV